MSTITDFILVMQTANKSNAETSDAFTIDVDYDSGGNLDFNMKTSDANQKTGWSKNLNSKGWAATFYWSVADVNPGQAAVTTENLTEVEITIDGSNAYTPGSIYLLAVSTSGDSDTSTLLAAYPFWNTARVLSQDKDEGSATYKLYPYDSGNEGGLDQFG